MELHNLPLYSVHCFGWVRIQCTYFFSTAVHTVHFLHFTAEYVLQHCHVDSINRREWAIGGRLRSKKTHVDVQANTPKASCTCMGAIVRLLATTRATATTTNNDNNYTSTGATSTMTTTTTTTTTDKLLYHCSQLSILLQPLAAFATTTMSGSWAFSFMGDLQIGRLKRSHHVRCHRSSVILQTPTLRFANSRQRREKHREQIESKECSRTCRRFDGRR